MPSPYFATPYGNIGPAIVEAVYRVASDGRIKERLLMVLLSLEGHRASKIAQIVHRDVDTVLLWLHRWNSSGFLGLHDSPHSGRPSVLTPDEQRQTVDWVQKEVASGKRLTCSQITGWIKTTFGKSIDHDTVRRLLHQHLCSWQKAGKKDYRADEKQQEEWNENLKQRMHQEPKTRFFFLDEAIFQLTTSTTYTWSKRGERPMVKANLSREKIIEMGAIEPLTGANFHLFVPETTKASVAVFLEEFAKAFPDDPIVLIHDGASWHRVPSPEARLELHPLPPYSPQLNPIERLWHWIRENFTHNCFFETLEELERALIRCLKDQETLRQVICSVCNIN